MTKVAEESKEEQRLTPVSDTHHILIADDDDSIRSLLHDFLEGEHFIISEARNGQEVLNALTKDLPDLVLLDARMPELDGISVLTQMQAQKNKVPMILMTAFGTSSLAIKAIQLGAYDYITKPFDLDDVLMTINRFFERQKLTREVENLRGKLVREPNERIIGNSAAMQQIYKAVGRVAGSDATVLITGETGTGKELVAQTLHYASSYARGPLIKVNCAALPETLLESELFGHEKGSFTGALAQRKGRFELAHKGTIFLDEIGEMTLSTQKKLLRVLQEREFERVGGTVPVKIDTRVIAATNRRLEDEVAAGRFRQDLYYRLNVVTLHMPPLRDRKDDIPLLVEHFLDKKRYTPTSPPSKISQEALDMFKVHDWPGNVRELENMVERSVVLAQGGLITSYHLIFSPTEARKFVDIENLVRNQTPLKSVIEDVEKQMIVEALKSVNGNRSEAAKALGIYRRLLYTKMKAYGLLTAGS